jgi:hypothetical protein
LELGHNLHPLFVTQMSSSFGVLAFCLSYLLTALATTM